MTWSTSQIHARPARGSGAVTANRVFNFYNSLSALTNFVVDSSGHPVHVPSGVFTSAADLVDLDDTMIRIFGRLIDLEGPCGGANTCYTLEYGPADALQTVTFRSSSNLIQLGACITYQGPISTFPGPEDLSATDRQPQLDSFDWAWTFIHD